MKLDSHNYHIPKELIYKILGLTLLYYIYQTRSHGLERFDSVMNVNVIPT